MHDGVVDGQKPPKLGDEIVHNVDLASQDRCLEHGVWEGWCRQQEVRSPSLSLFLADGANPGWDPWGCKSGDLALAALTAFLVAIIAVGLFVSRVQTDWPLVCRPCEGADGGFCPAAVGEVELHWLVPILAEKLFE